MKLFNRDKWKAKDISFQMQDGEPLFYVLLCIKWGPKGSREYQEKDAKLVEQIIGHIKRHNLSWWEVKEHTWSDDDGSYCLNYYPLRLWKHLYPNQKLDNQVIDMDNILEHFNWMVK